MSFRFQLMSDDDILGLMDVATSVHTKKQIFRSACISGVFRNCERSHCTDAEQLPNLELDNLLSLFYGSVRTSKGE